MKAKKILSFILAVMMICSFSAVNVFADEQTLCEKVGIGDLSAHKVIKFDGKENSETPTLQANTQVINLGDTIGLFSSPWSTYRLTGASACAAIVNSAVLNPEGGYVTESGYSLEYVSPSGNNDPSQTVENGGKIRATKDSEVIDIPVVDTVVSAVLGGDDTEGNGSLANNQTQLHSLVNASRGAQVNSGKAYNDKIFRFTVSPGATTYDSRWNRYNFNTNYNTPKTEITIEFQIRVTGDAKVSLEFEANGSGYGLLSYTSNGVLSYRSYDKNAVVEQQVCSDASEWHNIAFTYDYSGNRIIYYFDGQRLDTLGNLTSNGEFAAIRYIVPTGTYTVGGTVDFDNMVVRRGYYTGRGTTVESTALANNVGIDTASKKVYYNADSITQAELSSALLSITDAASASFYADSTLAAAALSTIAENNVVVLGTADKAHYETYEIVKGEDKLLIYASGSEIKANPLYANASAKLMIAEYAADGKELLGVKTGEDASSVSIADKTSEGRIYKAFLWNDLTSAQPVLSSVLYPAE